jgi:sugar-specific transcriptional regulator TrmB
MFQDEDVEALVALKLTSLQAKVYLALTMLGEAKIKAIAKAAQVARQDIYRVTTELQNLGLIEKVVASPVKFRAIPITDGVSILLQRTHQKRVESQKKAIKLIERSKNAYKTAKLPEKETQFVLIPEKEILSRRLKRAIKTTQKSIDVISPRMAGLQSLFDLFPVLQKALKRSVKIRWIIDAPLDPKSLPETLPVLAASPLFKLRSIPYTPEETFVIYDRKEAFIASHPKRGYTESPALWTNAAPLIELAQHYFDVLWNKATEARI